MRNDVINMSREKSESPTGIERTSELRRTRGELGHIQGSRMYCFLVEKRVYVLKRIVSILF